MTRQITDTGTLGELYGMPSDGAVKKQLDRLDGHCRHFISLSPFLVMATADSSGRCDASPKGDAPGFVEIVDERTLRIPDRLGNNRLDGMKNILQNPQIGLIFFMPGLRETLRVNGRARIVADTETTGMHAVNGKTPKTVIEVHVEEAYMHCGKALIRSRLWDPQGQAAAEGFPSLGRVVADQIAGVDPLENEARIERIYREELY
ncbi:MAG: pyridoxamine 5'-phosphate oxidase family protein [Geminicoccaceae bacterium]